MNRLLSRLSVTGLALAFAGCLPLWPISQSTPTPDFSGQIPLDLLTNAGEILMLTQIRSIALSGGLGEARTPIGKGQYKTAVAARFTKGRELRALNAELSLVTESGAYVASFVGGGAGSVTTRSILERVCLITNDARLVTLVPGAENWDKSITNPLAVLQRDATVGALRSEGAQPFEKADAPCGIQGQIDWSRELRHRVADFLSGLSNPEAGDAHFSAGTVLQ